VKRIVLAYSGADEPSAALARLKAEHGADVVTLTLDIGQGGALEAVRDRALRAGAARAHVLDLRDEFARDFILPSLKADALLEGRIPLAAALARPLIARKLLEVAAIEQASAVAHGGAPANRQGATVSASLAALDGPIEVIALGRPGTGSREAPRVEANIWGRLTGRGTSGLPPPASGRIDQKVVVDVAFSSGVPVSVNGVEMPTLDLIASLGLLAGAQGIGRHEGMDEDGTWLVVDAPAATVLHAAHRALQARVATPEGEKLAGRIRTEYAAIICSGQWFTPEREALDALVAGLQSRVAGTVRVQLQPGELKVLES
jgi:argininosuccinate synthase